MGCTTSKDRVVVGGAGTAPTAGRPGDYDPVVKADQKPAAAVVRGSHITSTRSE